MSKIHLDKYYTSNDLASRCIDILHRIVDKSNISQYIEPSAGNGSFSLQIDNCIGYDIEPEHKSIIRQDFLDLDINYMEGRCFIGNPPFGIKMNMAQKFFKKCVELGDYIAFILPISQLWNSSSMYEFDMIYSIDLGKVKYSDRTIHCCFNIYKRPNDRLNSKPKKTIDGITTISYGICIAN